MQPVATNAAIAAKNRPSCISGGMVMFPSPEHHQRIPLSRLPQQVRQLCNVRRDPSRLIARESSPLGHRLGLISLMDGAAPPPPFQFAPLSSSRPKQLG